MIGFPSSPGPYLHGVGDYAQEGADGDLPQIRSNDLWKSLVDHHCFEIAAMTVNPIDCWNAALGIEIDEMDFCLNASVFAAVVCPAQPDYDAVASPGTLDRCWEIARMHNRHIDRHTAAFGQQISDYDCDDAVYASEESLGALSTNDWSQPVRPSLICFEIAQDTARTIANYNAAYGVEIDELDCDKPIWEASF